FAWDSTPNGKLGATALAMDRPLSELAGLNPGRLRDASKFFNEPFDPEASSSLSGKSVKTREVWWEDGGALVLMGAGSGLKNKVEFSKDVKDGARILHRWTNHAGKPPFYIAGFGTPWVSPLIEMVNLTETRNYWATMQDIQASGAIFR